MATYGITWTAKSREVVAHQELTAIDRDDAQVQQFQQNRRHTASFESAAARHYSHPAPYGR